MRPRIVIAEDESITRMDLAEILTEAGYQVVGQAADGFDAIEICKRQKPDLVIMDVKMPVMDGLQATENIMEENLAGCVLMLTAYNDGEFVNRANDLGVMGYLVKPIEEKTLLPAVKIALRRNQEMHQYKSKVIEVEKKLEERKCIERAKGILMKKDGFSEEEAYAYLRNISMKKRCNMGKIADMIIRSTI
ncbi:ANTAR domain-containing response regulator [Proteiniclasticum sp. C24MP]|uniref:ANTAR domain-containing response regulator n=1 Tax=Proteiniclasticum sp. C24MP TaxID=3374101 RepID=UPI003754CD87